MICTLPAFVSRRLPVTSVVFTLMLALLAAPLHGQAGPVVSVNGVLAPAAVTTAGRMALSVTVTNGPANPGDWVGLFVAGAPDTERLDWKYLASNDQTLPATGSQSGTVNLIIPAAGGSFEVRFFSNDTYTLLAAGPSVSATAGQATAAAMGSMHGLAVSADGTVMGFGSGPQVGDGSSTACCGSIKRGAAARVVITPPAGTPPSVALSGVTNIAATTANSAALKADGTVWTWGAINALGDGYAGNRSTGSQIPNLSGVVALAGGDNHFIALKSDGTVWTWGSNGSGQIGNGTTSGTANAMPTPFQVTSLGSTVIAVAAGGSTSHALKADGTVWTWGDNQSGQVGNNTTAVTVLTPTQATTSTAFTRITAGRGTVYAWTSAGAVYAWGENGSGQLALGDQSLHRTPTLVAALAGAVSIAGGYSHSVALRADGTVVAWGLNGWGQVGDSSTQTRLTPVVVPGLTDMAAVGADTVGAWLDGSAVP